MCLVRIRYVHGWDNVLSWKYGGWAATHDITGWEVTQISSGLNLGMLATDLEEDDAKRIARALADRVPVFDIEYDEVGRDGRYVKYKRADKDQHRIIEATIAEMLAP